MPNSSMNRPDLILYIRKNDKFYEFTELEAHTIEQLLVIKNRIDSMEEKKCMGNKELGEKCCREARELN